jgi:carbamoyl-phosphate synthase large subunit
MSFENKRVFVSGGAGVIGKHLVNLLYDQGAIIFVGDLKRKPDNWYMKIYYRKGDLNSVDPGDIISFEPEYFFHLAATFERTFESPEFLHENFHHNVRLSNYLLSIMKRCKNLKKIIFASSYLIYDPKQYMFHSSPVTPCYLNELSNIAPRNLCGTAKYLHEKELSSVESSGKVSFNTISARIFRVYGEGSKDVVSRWVKRLLNGNSISIHNIEGMFDYIYAGDVAEGLINLAMCDATGVVNLGSGKASKISDILGIMENNFVGIRVEKIQNQVLTEGSCADMRSYRDYVGHLNAMKISDGIEKIIEYEKEKEALKKFIGE